MFHHQIKKKLSFNVQSQLLQLKSTTRSSSSRLHLHHSTKLQSFQLNHKTKRRHSSMFWLRSQMPLKILSSQPLLQHNRANQKSTSSSTRHKRNKAVLEVMLEMLEISEEAAVVTFQAHLQSVMTFLTAATSVFLLAVFHQANTVHQENKLISIKKRF